MLQFCWNQTNQSSKFLINSAILLSLPVWECGLKFFMSIFKEAKECVTPRVGVWIEILNTESQNIPALVTPRVGVWIEIC